MKGNRKFIGNLFLAACVTLVSMTGHLDVHAASVFGVIAMSFNGANAYEHQMNGRSNGQ